MKDKAVPQVKDAIFIAHSFYCKSQEALDNLMNTLSEDYNIKDCSKNELYASNTYYASLKEDVCQRKTKCNYCNHYNDKLGCKVHNYKCAHCGKILYKEYIHRARIRFRFWGESSMRADMTFLIHSYDSENGRILVYAKPQKSCSWMSFAVEEIPAYLENHEDKFERVEINGKKLLSFPLAIRGERNENNTKISICEVGFPPYNTICDLKTGKTEYTHAEEDMRCHYQEVCLFKGQEIKGDTYNLPVYDGFTIYPPNTKDQIPHLNLARNIMSAAGQVSDCGYYYQDGRETFDSTQFGWMALYIEHFTSLNALKFRQFFKSCRRDGPGFIVQFSQFITAETGVEQYIENKPNIGNLITGFCKLSNYELPTDEEVQAMGHALKDKKTSDDFFNLLGGFYGNR